MTPEQVHYNLSQNIYDNRAAVLLQAYNKNPNRFKGKIPLPPDIQKEVWINKPEPERTQVMLS